MAWFAGPLEDHVLQALKRLEEAQNKTLALVTINNSFQLDIFQYTEGKISPKSNPAAKAFSNRVKAAYRALDGGLCWCLLTNDRLPTSTVIGAHLFKWEWHKHMHVFGVSDISDVRNGLPLWKPIEWAL